MQRSSRRLFDQAARLALAHAHGGASTRAFSAQAPLAPISNVWCVGRNYEDHVRELGNAPTVPSADPMIFLKAGSSVLPAGRYLQLPSFSADVHHEVELAIQLDQNLEPCVAAAALDLTARDVQARLKKQQWPWTLAKSFPHSTPMASGFAVQGLDLQALELLLVVNGEVRQQGSTQAMIYPIPHLIKYVKAHFPVVPGDVVLTGTPAGVSALKAGDVVLAQVRDTNGHVLSDGRWGVVGHRAGDAPPPSSKTFE